MLEGLPSLQSGWCPPLYEIQLANVGVCCIIHRPWRQSIDDFACYVDFLPFLSYGDGVDLFRSIFLLRLMRFVVKLTFLNLF